MSAGRILIAEDDESILALEKKILESAGYEVDCALTGDLALRMATENRYAVIVADVMMPGLDGIDLTREIAKIYQKQVPVLLVTAMQDVLKTAHGREVKPMSTLQKPFTPHALITAVNMLASRGKQESAKFSTLKQPLSKEQVEKKAVPVPAKPMPPRSSPAKPAIGTDEQATKKKGWFEKLFN